MSPLSRHKTRGRARAAPKMGMDVLDDDRRLVDQYADRQRQTAEGHQVDCLAGRPQRYRRRQDRQRDVHHHDQSASPIAQEQQHHQSREHRAEHALFGQTQDGARDEGRLIELVADFHARWQHRLEFWDFSLTRLTTLSVEASARLVTGM